MSVGNYRFFLLSILALIALSLGVFGQVPANLYLNDSGTYNKGTGNVSFTFNASGTRVNLDLSENPVHIFEVQTGPSNAKWIVEYNSSNATGYLLKLRIWDESGISNDKIEQFDCTNTGLFSTICDTGCGNFNFRNINADPLNFTVMFNYANDTFNIRIGNSSIVRASGSLCPGNTSIGNIIFAPNSDSGADQFTVDRNIVTADNRAPTFTGSFQNISFPEDTNYSANLSGKFSDLDSQNLTLGYSDLENISITINQSSGIAKLIPNPNFNGIRYVRFFANDSENITYSNNVTINVTPVNDPPTVSGVMLNNTDFLNRRNGSLVAGWTFNDIDGDPIRGNETLWYVNGTENITFKNLTAINANNLSKNQNWTFSVRVFDGTDFSDFANSTMLAVINSVPTQSIPIINSTDDNQRKNGTLTCSNQSTNDLDNDLVTNFIKWFRNNILVNESINSINLSAGNYSKNDNLTCEITPFDGSINGTARNSTNFTILNAAPLINNSIANKAWNKDTSATISLANAFFDIDNDNLTYNYSEVSNIAISINNSTAIATLNPSSGFTGTRFVVFYAYDGTNLTSSNNVTLTVNDVAQSSGGGGTSSSSGGGGGSSGGGGGSGNYICELNWKCDDWSGCADGKQSRKCVLIQVPVFTLNDKCPQNTVPEQSRDCLIPFVKKETCDDGIKNQNEEGIDCGGVCKPCSVQEPKKEETKPAGNAITGAAVANPKGFDYNNIWLMIAVVLAAASLLLYANYERKRIFKKNRLNEQEMNKLNEMLNYRMIKK